MQATTASLTARFDQLARAASSWKCQVRLEQDEARSLLLSLRPCDLVFDGTTEPTTALVEKQRIFGITAALDPDLSSDNDEEADSIDFAGRLIHLNRFLGNCNPTNPPTPALVP